MMAYFVRAYFPNGLLAHRKRSRCGNGSPRGGIIFYCAMLFLVPTESRRLPAASTVEMTAKPPGVTYA